MLKQKGSPRWGNGGNPGNQISAVDIDSILADAVDTWEAEAQRLRLLRGGRPVFVVATTYRPSGVRRNTVFMTAPGAQRHAMKLIERGHEVRIELATLTPTAVLLGGESS